MSEIYLSKEVELQLQAISDSNGIINLLLELLKLTLVWLALFPVNKYVPVLKEVSVYIKKANLQTLRFSANKKWKVSLILLSSS